MPQFETSRGKFTLWSNLGHLRPPQPRKNGLENRKNSRNSPISPADRDFHQTPDSSTCNARPTKLCPQRRKTEYQCEWSTPLSWLRLVAKTPQQPAKLLFIFQQQTSEMFSAGSKPTCNGAAAKRSLFTDFN